MSRHNFSLADQVYRGRVVYPAYQGDKLGIEHSPLYAFRPTGRRAATFTAPVAAGATSAVLNAVWAGLSGLFPIIFSDGSGANVLLTNGSTAATFYPTNISPRLGNYGAVYPLPGAVTASVTVLGQPPILGVANTISLSQAITAGTPALLNGASVVNGVAVLDVPRNIIAAWTGAAVLTVTGTDALGVAQTESSASGTTFTGKKTFATITAVNVGTSVTAATVGTGNVLGLPFRIRQGDLFNPTVNNVADVATVLPADITAPATATTGDVRGTIAFASALDGVKAVAALLYVADAQTQVGAFGVTPV